MKNIHHNTPTVVRFQHGIIPMITFINIMSVSSIIVEKIHIINNNHNNNILTHRIKEINGILPEQHNINLKFEQLSQYNISLELNKALNKS